MTSIHVRRLEDRVARTTARLVDFARRERLDVAQLAEAKLPWYEIRSAVDANGVPATDIAEVLIFDEIGGSLGVSAKRFAMDLQEITAPTIRVRINSPGGSVFDAIAIHNSLLHHPSRVEVYVDSLAASAASVIAMAGDEVVMMPGSQLMIHDASAVEDGNAADHGKMQTFLDRQSDNLAEFYQRRGGGETPQWRELMLAETWMFAAEAVESGLADRVHQRTDLADDRMTRGFDLSRYGYRYAGRSQAPAPPRRAAPAREVREYVPVATTNPRSPSDTEFAEAAQRRAARVRNGPIEPPGGQARSVDTGWLHRSRGGLAADQPLPKRLSAKKVERDGKQFYVVEGYYTVHERGYEMWDENGPYVEIVSSGAGSKTIAANPDVVFLVNHRGLAMARTVAGTLELWSDSVGDANRAWLNPQRQDVKDLVLGIEDGTITEQSFAFMIDSGHWSADFTQYRIDTYDIDRGDTSAVNYGANPHTSIAARSREILAALDALPTGAARAALERLQSREDLPDTGNSRSVSQVDAWLAAVAAGK